jgi:hypothetical protein
MTDFGFSDWSRWAIKVKVPLAPPEPGTGFGIWVRPKGWYLTDHSLRAEADHYSAVGEYNAYHRGYVNGQGRGFEHGFAAGYDQAAEDGLVDIEDV